MGDYEAFAEACTQQDTVALVEYAQDMLDQGCAISFHEHRRRLQQHGMAKLVDVRSTCPWDALDDRLDDVNDECCADTGASAEYTCRGGSPPQTCSPLCTDPNPSIMRAMLKLKPSWWHGCRCCGIPFIDG